jgi:16S rRNA (adenine1518-N6/adenine1519-N6)-dimethyltransferase
MLIAKKRFGQVFLRAPSYIRSILDAIPKDPLQTLLEIGPGQGALTGLLSEKAAHVYAVEIDRDLAKTLVSKLQNHGNIQVIQEDFLKTDLGRFVGKGGRLTIVGNLPYNVASLILLKLLNQRVHVREAMVMVQREVGDRITAPPGRKDFSFLSAAIGTFATPKRLFLLPPGAFRPIPKVESAFLRLSFDKPRPDLPDTRSYLTFLTRAFAQRRKKVIKVLSKHYPQAALDSFFGENGLDPNARAESLAVETLVKLYHTLHG